MAEVAGAAGAARAPLVENKVDQLSSDKAPEAPMSIKGKADAPVAAPAIASPPASEPDQMDVAESGTGENSAGMEDATAPAAEVGAAVNGSAEAAVDSEMTADDPASNGIEKPEEPTFIPILGAPHPTERPGEAAAAAEKLSSGSGMADERPSTTSKPEEANDDPGAALAGALPLTDPTAELSQPIANPATAEADDDPKPGDKRKLDKQATVTDPDEGDGAAAAAGAAASPEQETHAGDDGDGEEPAEKKVKSNGGLARRGSRAGRKNKAAMPAGRTERKTRSQGPA